MINIPILIMGLPGSGKTTLATHLAVALKAVHWNADLIRENINKDLKFTQQDRIEQSARMGWLSKTVTDSGYPCIADLVCPTDECRTAFGPAFIIWVDRIDCSRFSDTNALFIKPQKYNCRIEFGMNIQQETLLVLDSLANYDLVQKSKIS